MQAIYMKGPNPKIEEKRRFHHKSLRKKRSYIFASSYVLPSMLPPYCGLCLHISWGCECLNCFEILHQSFVHSCAPIVQLKTISTWEYESSEHVASILLPPLLWLTLRTLQHACIATWVTSCTALTLPPSLSCSLYVACTQQWHGWYVTRTHTHTELTDETHLELNINVKSAELCGQHKS